jgi:hypothetical protein
MSYMIREGRHMGVSMLLDSLRMYGIDIDTRSLADHLILKSQGVENLNKDLNFLYHYIKPEAFRRIPPEKFVILSRKGAIGVGRFKIPSWHKLESENILDSVGLKIEYGTPIETGENRGRFKTVGDWEHSQIVQLYLEGSSMNKISGQIKRSTKTVLDHINDHNSAVERSQFFPSCRRVHSEHEGEKAARTT